MSEEIKNKFENASILSAEQLNQVTGGTTNPAETGRTKVCPYCQTEIDAAEFTCPNCHNPLTFCARR